MTKRKRVLVCPLNWGLGHATRDVEIIRNELSKGNEVIIAGDGYPLNFLRQEFPQLEAIEAPSYNIKYSKKNTQVFAILKLLPSLFLKIKEEHNWLKNTVKERNIDIVISDNRFGLWHKEIHSIYITHQIMIKMPKALKWLEPFGYLFHNFFIRRYNECWIPDTDINDGLSGDLSHKYPLPKKAKYIGVLSRFSTLTNVAPITEYENVIILSGVEPQRTIFQNLMTERYKEKHEKSLMIIGKPTEKVQHKNVGQIDIVSHVESEKLAALFKGAKNIISHAGYSTIMDLHILQCLKKAQLYPTPGQTEQEYLVFFLNSKGYTQTIE